MKWLLAALVLLYALSPYDLFPDLIVGWGWLDDIILLGLIWYLFFRRPRIASGQSTSDGKRRFGGSTRISHSALHRIRPEDPYSDSGLA